MKTIKFDKLYKDARIAEPVSICIPARKGKLRDLSNYGIYKDGKRVRQQSKVTARYDDGSIKYIFTRFMADLPANKGTSFEYSFKADKDIDNDQSDNYYSQKNDKNGLGIETISVKDNKGSILVDNGILSFAVSDKSEHIFDWLEYGAKRYDANDFYGPILTDKLGKVYDFKIDKWKVIETGDVCCILSGVGNGFEIRITSYYGKEYLDISHLIINNTDDEMQIKSLIFSLSVKGDANLKLSNSSNNATAADSTGCGDLLTDNSKNEGPLFITRGLNELSSIEDKAKKHFPRTVTATSNYKTSFNIGIDGYEVKNIIDANYLLSIANEHFAEVFFGTFFVDYTCEEGGVCASVFQAYQNFPKAVKADKNGLVIYLVPEDCGDVTLLTGMAKEHRFLLHFHDSEYPISELDNRSLIYQMPDRPYISAKEFKKAGVMPDIFPKNLDSDFELSLIAKGDNHSRCYGVVSWGDSIDVGYTKQGRGAGRSVWSNNEYDNVHALALMYARTGIRRFYDYMYVSGSHEWQIDVCHYHPEKKWIGGQWEHTANHARNGIMVCSHQWVEGLLDLYHFTGDERAFDAALGIGESILRLLDEPMLATPGEANARETGWALRALVALYNETNDEKWLKKCEWIIDSFKVWEESYGSWVAPYTDNTAIRVGFMISVAVGSIMRYYRVFPREELKEMMIREVDELIENCFLDNGLFTYKELPSIERPGNNTLLLESMAIAYELTGDDKYLKYGLETFRRSVRAAGLSGAVSDKKIDEESVVCTGGSSKTFAQSFIPLTTYQTSLEKAKINPWNTYR